MLSDLPPVQPDYLVCSIMAAVKYEVPVNIVLAIAEKEGGKPGQWVKNSNGSYDVGFMQFNTNYLKDLKKYGISTYDVSQDNCYSFDLAAWRLRGHLKNDKADLWTRASNYHSKTPKYNIIYRSDLIKKAKKWQVYLESHFQTYLVSKPGIAPVKALFQPLPKQIVKPKNHRYNKEAAYALAAVFAPEKLNNRREIP